jgi:hypothetical protein
VASLSYRAATRRHCLILLKKRSTKLRALYSRWASASPSRVPGVLMSVNTRSIGSPDSMNSIAASAHAASIT